MGKAAIPTQVFALIGVSTVAATVHSLIVPIDLVRRSDGFTVPGSRPDVGDEAAVDVSGGGSSDQADPGSASPPSGAEPASEDGLTGKVSLSDAAALHASAMAGELIVFLDARLEADFAAGHILGAVSMPFTRLGDGDGIDVIMDMATPGDETLFVIYCTGGDCEASEDTAIRLEQLGYTNIAIMADGYDDWAKAGLPVQAPGEAP